MQTVHDTRPTRVEPETAGDPAELAGTRRSRLLTSVLIVAILSAVGVSVMPDSVLKNEALVVARPALSAVGLDQTWGVFSPDPRRQASTMLTIVERSDGTRVVLPQPAAIGPAQLADYRWRTLLTQLGARDREQDRLAYARWVADQDRAAGHQPVRVSLVRRAAVLAPPGPGPDQGPWVDSLVSSTVVGR